MIGAAEDPDRTGGFVFAHPVNRTSRSRVAGSPSLADLEQGRPLFDCLVEDFSATIKMGLIEQPLLDASDFADVPIA